MRERETRKECRVSPSRAPFFFAPTTTEANSNQNANTYFRVITASSIISRFGHWTEVLLLLIK